MQDPDITSPLRTAESDLGGFGVGPLHRDRTIGCPGHHRQHPATISLPLAGRVSSRPGVVGSRSDDLIETMNYVATA